MIIHKETAQSLRKQVARHIKRGEYDAVIQIFRRIHPADQAKLFMELDQEKQKELLSHMEIKEIAEMFDVLDDQQTYTVAHDLPLPYLADIINEMDPDEAADLLGDLSGQDARRTISLMEKPDDVLPLLRYSDETAGGRMTTDFLVLEPDESVDAAIEYLREVGHKADLPYYLYVINNRGKLVGVAGLREIVIAEPPRLIQEIMDPEVISIQATHDQEEAAKIMKHYDLLSLPVIDENQHLVGVIAVDDVLDVIVDEATEDFQRLGGAEPLGQSYLDTSVFQISKTRIGWLLLLFLTGSLTGTVLRHFEEELAAVVALSFFVPLLIGTGGNAGSQTTSTIIRAIAVDELNLQDGLRTLWHEFRVGLTLGAGISIVGYGRALAWGQSSGVALAVSVSIFAIVVWANVIGAVLPLLAEKLNIDPTSVSAPVMSTLVDATGLYIYFTIAKLILGI